MWIFLIHSFRVKELFDAQYVSERKPFRFSKGIKVLSSATVAGKKEKQGPLGKYIDIYCDDEKLGKDNWEEAESEMSRMALETALSKAGLCESSIDILIAGDLMNQCTSSSYGLATFDIPYFGLYGACSTFAEGIMIAGVMIESGFAKSAAVAVSSHFCTAERQFRFPLEYGSFSETTAQNTVTGSGCVILCEADKNDGGVFLTSALPGIVCDRGIKDAANMGAAMSTAAADTVTRFFENSDKTPSDFDLVVTGDLGKEGYLMALEMMRSIAGIKEVYNDCGLMIYDIDEQKVGSGGSGCGCSAVVTSGYILNSLSERKMKRAAVIGTGAMMSPQSLLQGQSIPSIAHLVEFESR